MEGQLSSSIHQLNDLRNQLDKVSLARTTAEHQAHELTALVDTLRAEAAALQQRMQGLVDTGTAANRRNSELEQQLQRYINEKDDLAGVLKEVDDAKGMIEASLASLESDLDKSKKERDAMSMKCATLTADKTELEAELAHQKESFQALTSERGRILEEAEDSINGLENKVKEADARTKKIRDEQLTLQETCDKLTHKLRKSGTIGGIEADTWLWMWRDMTFFFPSFYFNYHY